MRIKHLRGATEYNNTLVLPEGVISVDSDLNSLRIHDGISPGGSTVNSSVVLEGPSEIPTEVPIEYTIVNHDSFSTYTCTVDVGEVELTGATVVLKVPAFTEVVELTLFRDGVGTQYKIPTEFEGILGQVTELSSGPIRRSVAGGVIDGKFYMFGGVLSNSSPVDGLNDMWVYDPQDDVWTEIQQIDPPDISTLSISASHTIGDSIYAHTGVRSITRFDINTREFTEVEQSLRVRHFYAAVTIGNAIAVQGGRPAPTHSPIGLLDLYDPKTNTWENIPLSSNDVRRFEHFMFRIGSKLYVYGGRSQLLHQTNTGTLFEIV